MHGANSMDALNALPANKRASPVAARQGLEFCNRLFAIERDLEEATPEERRQARLERSRPVLDAFSEWLHDQKTKCCQERLGSGYFLLPKSVGQVNDVPERWPVGDQQQSL